MHPTRTAGVSSIIVVLIGAAAIGAGALMSSNQVQSPNNLAINDTRTTTASSSVAISVEEEGVKRTVRDKEEDSVSSEPLDVDHDNDTAPGTESDTSRVTYSTDGFSPQTLNVSVGTTVQFENVSGAEMWVVSDSEDYDDVADNERCLDPEDGDLNQCEVGEEFSFTFNSVGEFDYYNQKNLEHAGTIVVTEE